MDPVNIQPDLQPTLAGKLIELRPLREDDFPELYRAASDPLIWEQHPESDRYKEEVFRKYFDGAMASRGAFAIIDKKTGEIIGSSRYCNYDPERREVEVGWTFLTRPYWGGEYNRELKELMLRHAFGFVDRVLFVVGPENYRSQRAMEKIGGKRIPNAEGRTSVLFEITAPVFESVFSK